MVETLSDGEIVTEWTDRIGNIAAQGTGQARLTATSVGGRAAVQFDPADGRDLLEVARTDNPVNERDAFSIMIAFRTSAGDLQGAEGEPWFHGTGLVDSNSLGFGPDWGMSLNENGQVQFGLGDSFVVPPVTLSADQTPPLNNGALHLVTATRSGSDLAIYVDDLPAATRDDASSKTRGSFQMAIGGLLDQTLGDFAGEIAQMRIYDGQLSAVEVEALHADVLAHYSNSAPVAHPDEYTTEEDGNIF